MMAVEKVEFKESGECQPYFMKEETGTERMSDLPNFIQLTWSSLPRSPLMFFPLLGLYSGEFKGTQRNASLMVKLFGRWA